MKVSLKKHGVTLIGWIMTDSITVVTLYSLYTISLDVHMWECTQTACDTMWSFGSLLIMD